MPSLVIPDALQVTLFWLNSGVAYANNVLHFRNDQGDPVDTALANFFGSMMQTAAAAGAITFRSGLADEIVLQTVGVRSLNVANEPMVTSTTGPYVTGTSSSDPLPSGVSLVSTLRTNKAGRSYRGRSYWPGFAEGTNSPGGNPTANVVTSVQNLTTSIRTQASASGFPWCVASRKNLELYPITNITVDARWDTQRRRHVPGI